jgi:hypothetical protein
MDHCKFSVCSGIQYTILPRLTLAVYRYSEAMREWWGSEGGARPIFTPLGCSFSCCKDPDLVALLKLGLLTTPCHLLRLLDLLGGHV